MTFIKKHSLDGIFIGFLLFLCYVVFFRHLDEFTLRLWDEGRNATNALEMTRNGNLGVTYFNGGPDMWNVKPPLHIWIVALFFKMLGVSELSLRLPSAISASLTVLGMYVFGWKVLKNRWIGMLGALIILSSMGFPDIHIGRTGDYDALLTFFSFGAAAMTFIYLRDFNAKYIYLAGLLWTTAVLTKGVAGLLLMPGVALYLILSGKLPKIIKQFDFWKAIFISVVIIGGYYAGREGLNHGYLKAVLTEDIVSRYGKDIGSGGNDFWYYWKLLASFRFQKWIYFLPVSIIGIFLTKDKTIKHFIAFAFLLAISYLIIISNSGTKQFWYDAQMYPLASLGVAAFIVVAINKMPWILRIFPLIILSFYMQRYIRTNIAYIHRPDLDKTAFSCIRYGYLFRDKTIDKEGFTGVHKDGSCSPFLFYFESNNLPTKPIEAVKTGDKILTCDEATFNEIKGKNKVEPIFDNKTGCVGFTVLK